jgi:GTP-binding protein YchF
MGLSCGLIGVPSCGKTVIFNAITAANALSYDGSEMNRAVVKVPDGRLNRLSEMYRPQKTTQTTLEVVDIPGLKANPGGNGRGSRLLGHIKNVEVLLHVIRCFEDSNVPFEYDTVNPVRDIETVDIELMTADSVTLDNKVKRLAKRVRSGDKEAIQETADCEKVQAGIQQGIPARRQNLNSHEIASVADCFLVSSKPVIYIANIKSVEDANNRHVTALKQYAQAACAEVITVCGKDEAEVSQLAPHERQDFLKALGIEQSSMERLIQVAYRALGLSTFFTTGEDEVRAWTFCTGDKAPVAAGKIHSDMEKGFIRMEVIPYQTLVELGSEAAVAKAGLKRVESRDYIVQDADIVSVLFNNG